MLQKNKWYVNLDVFNVHHLLTKIIAQDNIECKQIGAQFIITAIFFADTDSKASKKLQPDACWHQAAACNF